jgi:thiamine pyrophosphokinase
VSSHHFVKEDQEPALLILNATTIAHKKVQELLEWSPTVIVHEQALSDVLSWGIKIDVILCADASASQLKASLSDQDPLRFITYTEGVEALSTAANFLTTSNYKAVNILINEVSQLDAIQSFQAMDLEFFHEGKRWVYTKTGRYEKWLPKGFQLFVYGNIEIVRTGLNEYLQNETDGMVSMKSNVPFWIGEALD